jgi:hypothetical protein
MHYPQLQDTQEAYCTGMGAFTQGQCLKSYILISSLQFYLLSISRDDSIFCRWAVRRTVVLKFQVCCLICLQIIVQQNLLLALSAATCRIPTLLLLLLGFSTNIHSSGHRCCYSFMSQTIRRLTHETTIFNAKEEGILVLRTQIPARQN